MRKPSRGNLAQAGLTGVFVAGAILGAAICTGPASAQAPSPQPTPLHTLPANPLTRATPLQPPPSNPSIEATPLPPDPAIEATPLPPLQEQGQAGPDVAAPQPVPAPGTGLPRVVQPGQMGTAQPGTTEPGTNQPGTAQPGALPPGAPGTAGANAEGPVPQTEPPGSTPPPAAMTLPNTWLPAGEAKLRALDKVSAEVSLLTVKVGQTVTFGSLEITVKACVVRPKDQPSDAAAYLQVIDKHPDTPPFNGWMLEKEPSVSMLQNPVYDLSVAGCV